MSEIVKLIDVGEGENKTNTKSNKGVVQAILKVWELNDFAARLS